jgi:hypothetical protein
LTESVNQEITPAINQPNYNNTSQNLDTNRDSIIISNLELLTSRDYSLNANQENNNNVHSLTNTTGAKNFRVSSSLSNQHDIKRFTKLNKPETLKRQDSFIRPLSKKAAEPAITVG